MVLLRPSLQCLCLSLLSLLMVACGSLPLARDPQGQTAVDQAAGSAAQRIPQALPAEYVKVQALMVAGQYEQALAPLRALQERHSQQAAPLVNLSIALYGLGRLEEALSAAQQAVSLEPENAAAQHQYGIVARASGDFDAAEQAYGRALQLQQDYALAHRNMGILLDLYRHRPEQALKHYRRYLELAQPADEEVERWVTELERRITAGRN